VRHRVEDPSRLRRRETTIPEHVDEGGSEDDIQAEGAAEQNAVEAGGGMASMLRAEAREGGDEEGVGCLGGEKPAEMEMVESLQSRGGSLPEGELADAVIPSAELELHRHGSFELHRNGSFELFFLPMSADTGKPSTIKTNKTDTTPGVNGL
jgi:hypothetical protein